MGEEGGEVIAIPNVIEKCGGKICTTTDLSKFRKEFPKVLKYDRSINVALFNWTAGIVQG